MATLFWSLREALHVFPMFKVFDDAVLDAPPQKVELGARRCEPLEIDALSTAKRIKELLAIGLELTLVIQIDEKFLTIQDIGSTVSL